MITEHVKKANASEYDGSAAVLAMAVVRAVVAEVPHLLSDKDYSEQIIAAVGELMGSYRDPDGEFASGANDLRH